MAPRTTRNHCVLLKLFEPVEKGSTARPGMPNNIGHYIASCSICCNAWHQSPSSTPDTRDSTVKLFLVTPYPVLPGVDLRALIASANHGRVFHLLCPNFMTRPHMSVYSFLVLSLPPRAVELGTQTMRVRVDTIVSLLRSFSTSLWEG